MPRFLLFAALWTVSLSGLFSAPPPSQDFSSPEPVLRAPTPPPTAGHWRALQVDGGLLELPGIFAVQLPEGFEWEPLPANPEPLAGGLARTWQVGQSPDRPRARVSFRVVEPEAAPGTQTPPKFGEKGPSVKELASAGSGALLEEASRLGWKVLENRSERMNLRGAEATANSVVLDQGEGKIWHYREYIIPLSRIYCVEFESSACPPYGWLDEFVRSADLE